MEDTESLNCSKPTPTPSMEDMFRGMTNTQKICFYAETFTCAWLLLLLMYDFFYFKRILVDHPRLRSVLFIQSTFVFYATTSLLSVLSPRSSTLTDLVFTVYFSFTLKEILSVMINYLGGDICASINMEGEQVQLAVSPLCCLLGRCCPVVLMSRNYLYWIKFGVYQSAVLHTIFDFISAFLWSDGLYMEGYNDPQKLAFYLQIFEKVSILVAMYSLTSLFSTTRKYLQPFHIMGKFLCIQITMVISGFQMTIFYILAILGVIECTDMLSATDRATVFNHYAIVPEMALMYVVSRYFHTRDEGATGNAFSDREAPAHIAAGTSDDEQRPLL